MRGRGGFILKEAGFILKEGGLIMKEGGLIWGDESGVGETRVVCKVGWVGLGWG